MNRRFLILSLVLLLVSSAALTSCGGSDYKIFSLREGIGHFSMEYPPDYTVVRIDIRNDAASRYTDIGFRVPQSPGDDSFGEISVYAWPIDMAESSAALVLDDLLGRAAGIFSDFKLLDQYSIMVGDMDGQAAVFSWMATPANDYGESDAGTLPAVSRIVCFCHGDLAWEIHLASDSAAPDAEDEFNHIIDTFQILN
jgi:hypothetical protein